MNCKACGTENIAEAVFCQKCGERLNERDFAAGAAESSPAPEAKPVPDSMPVSSESPAERLRQAVGGDDDDDPEEDLWDGGYSPKAMIGSWIGAGLISILLGIGAFTLSESFWTSIKVFIGGMLIIWAAAGCLLIYRRLSVYYELTSQRFVHKRGVLRRVTDRIEVIDMDDVTFEQGLVQRVMGVGTIRIVSSDKTHPELTLIGIDDVKRVAGLIDDVRRKERRRRGLHIEAI